MRQLKAFLDASLKDQGAVLSSLLERNEWPSSRHVQEFGRPPLEQRSDLCGLWQESARNLLIPLGYGKHAEQGIAASLKVSSVSPMVRFCVLQRQYLGTAAEPKPVPPSALTLESRTMPPHTTHLPSHVRETNAYTCHSRDLY